METPGLGDGDGYIILSQVHELDRLSEESFLEPGFRIQGGSFRGFCGSIGNMRGRTWSRMWFA